MNGTVVLACCLIVFASAVPACAQSSTPGKPPAVQVVKDATEGPPIVFYADLSADEESAETYSPGIGRFECALERKTLKLTWKVTYQKLTSPVIGAGIHGPQSPGAEAGVLVDLGGKGLTSPIEGSSILNEGQLEYLLTDRMYVNILTKKYPGGELRGQLARLRPTTADN